MYRFLPHSGTKQHQSMQRKDSSNCCREVRITPVLVILFIIILKRFCVKRNSMNCKTVCKYQLFFGNYY